MHSASVLYEVATGSRLYRSRTAAALEQEVLTGDIRRPSDAAVQRDRARALRGDLDAIILTALRRRPEDRYESAAAFADDLEHFLIGMPVRAHPDSRAYRLRKFVARNSIPAVAVAAVSLALTVGSGVALWQANVARQQAVQAKALNTFVLSLIRQADPNASPQAKAEDIKLVARIEERIDKEFDGTPEQLLNLRLTIGDAYRNRGEMRAAQRAYQGAVDGASGHVPPDHLGLLGAKVRAADDRLIVSTRAALELHDAIERLKALGAEGADLLIEALVIRTRLGVLFGVPEHTPVARHLDNVEEALALAKKYFGEGSRQHLRIVPTYASLVANSGRREEAYAHAAKALVAAESRNDVPGTSEHWDVRIYQVREGLPALERRARPSNRAPIA